MSRYTPEERKAMRARQMNLKERRTCPKCLKEVFSNVGSFKTHQRFCGTSQDRFWSRVDQSAGEQGCWPWPGYKQPDGYGQFRFNSKTLNVHKIAYELVKGKVPAGLEVMHSCHVRHCCNPSHMSVGTHLENMAHSARDDRHARGERSGKAKLTDDQVREIRRIYQASPNKHGIKAQLARQFNMTSGHIGQIATGRRWSHIQ